MTTPHSFTLHHQSTRIINNIKLFTSTLIFTKLFLSVEISFHEARNIGSRNNFLGFQFSPYTVPFEFKKVALLSTLPTHNAITLEEVDQKNDENLMKNLTAPYLKPLLKSLEKICFQRSKREPDIFDKAASTLRLSSYKLRSDIATLQRKYITELIDDFPTRVLLGQIILHTAHRQAFKSSFTGIPKEVLYCTNSILLSTESLSKLNEFASRYNYSTSDWEGRTKTSRKQIIFNILATKPGAVTDVLLESMKLSGTDADSFMINLLNSTRFKTRGGKRFARKFLNEKCRNDHALKIRQRGSNSTSYTDSNFIKHENLWYSSKLSLEFYSWIKKECGNIRNKLKNEIYKSIFSTNNILRSSLPLELDMEFLKSDIWRNSTYLQDINESKANRHSIAQNMMLQLDNYATNETQKWKIFDLLLKTAGFDKRQTFIDAISHVANDRKLGLQLKHFKNREEFA